jgi:nitrate/TMAO reductase-like tetraheme cytochrome c subunit
LHDDIKQPSEAGAAGDNRALDRPDPLHPAGARKPRIPSALRAILLLVGVIVIGGLAVTGGAVAISSNSDFCATCHEIKPLVDEWKRSAHKDTNCLSCHTSPGPKGYVKVVSQGSQDLLDQLHGDDTLPLETTLDDASCLSCHKRELRPEELRQATLKVAHSKHTGQRCTECHSGLAHPRQFQSATQTKAQMDPHAAKDCQICHPSPEPAYLHGQAKVECNSCHSATIPNHNLAQKQGTMQREGCIECHNRLRVADPTSCEVCHVSPHGIDQNCQACHSSTKGWTDKVFAHPLALKEPHNKLKCNQCHGGATFQSGTFNCVSCHQPKHPLYSDNCVSCHKPNAWKPAQMNLPKSP